MPIDRSCALLAQVKGSKICMKVAPQRPAKFQTNRRLGRSKLLTILVSVKGQAGSARGWAKRGLHCSLIFRSEVIIYLRALHNIYVRKDVLFQPRTYYAQGLPVSRHITRPATRVNNNDMSHPTQTAIGEKKLIEIALILD